MVRNFCTGGLLLAERILQVKQEPNARDSDMEMFSFQESALQLILPVSLSGLQPIQREEG